MNDETKPTRPAPDPTNFSQPFWDAAKEKKLVLQYCLDSGKYQFYPRPVSQVTGKRNLEWREVSGKGEVFSYTVTRRPPPVFKGAEPYVLGSIELDEGVRMMSPIVGCAPEDVKVGMRVRVAWEENEGFNYPVFEPDA
jgi:uncharacterized OB-fold protein